jgi:hypothetical protein
LNPWPHDPYSAAMSIQHITVTIEEQIATVTLNRPD